MGEVIGAGELHKGVKLLIDGEPWEITEFDFSKPGKGQAIYNCKLRNMMTGGGMTKSYRSGDKFEKPELIQQSVTYSYDDGTAFVFTDDDFAEIRVAYDVMGDKKYFLMDEMEVKALFFNDAVIGVDLPQLVESSRSSPASRATRPPARSPSRRRSRADTSAPSRSSSTRAT